MLFVFCKHSFVADPVTSCKGTTAACDPCRHLANLKPARARQFISLLRAVSDNCFLTNAGLDLEGREKYDIRDSS